MKPPILSLGSALAWAAWTGSGLAHSQTAPAGLRVYTSIEVEFTTETNRYFALQGSSDLQQWSTIGQPVFGNGQVVKRLFSTRSGENVRFATYRLAVVESTTVSHAPWELTGLQLAFHDDSDLDTYRFLTSSNGLRRASGDDAFTYSFTKTGENVAELNLLLPEGRSNHVVLQFATDSQGTFMLDRYRDERLKGRDLGTFNLGPIPTPTQDGAPPETNSVPVTPTSTPPAVPADLAGRAFSFSAGGEPDRLEFSSATAGWEREDRPGTDDDGGRKAFTYVYSITSSNQAAVTLDFGRGRTDAYTLTFTVGEQGSFVRRELRDGSVHDVDRGRFSAAGTIPTSAGTPSADTTGDTSGTATNGSGTSSMSGDNATPATPPADGAATGGDSDYWNRGVAPEPGDDKGGNRPPTTGADSNNRGGSADGGQGGSNGAPLTDSGTSTSSSGEAQPASGDDRGGPSTGGGQPVEPGDDRGTDTTTTGTTTESSAGTPTGGGSTGGVPPAATAPAALLGLALDFGSDVYRFSTATTGVKVGSGSPDSFAYEYLADGSPTAHLKVIVKPDRWFESTLVFAADGQGGTYVQREMRSGILKAEKNGGFTVVP